jgi:DNA-binding transcriptional MerR regulator
VDGGEVLSRRELAAKIGVSLYAVTHWHRQGLLVSVAGRLPSGGGGGEHRYAPVEVAVGQVLAAARTFGMPLDTDLMLARTSQLRPQLAAAAGRQVVVAVGLRRAVVLDPGAAPDPLELGGMWLSVRLEVAP